MTTSRSSDEFGDGTDLQGLMRQLDHDFVDEAPAPAIGRIIALDNRMPCRVEVCRGMPMRGVIAAAHVTTRPTNAQVYPGAANLQAFLASPCAWFDLANC